MVFVGEERREIVADLVTAFDEIKGGGTSRLVTLVSMPGWGKTRIIQEFYSSLALEQNEPHYWPDSLVVIEDGEEGILGARKLVHPAHMTERPDGAALDYMWWGISCKKDPNSSNLEEVLDRAAEQVANHALGRQSLEELKGEFLGASVDLSTNLLSVLGLVGLVVFPPLGAAGTIVGAAKFAWDRREAFQLTKTALAERRAKGRPIDLATSREEADDQLVRFLTRWSAKVPMVIVLDDAQWATERTISVLNQLLTSNESRVLIVATTWPHEVSTINALGGHAHHFQERWADWQQRLPERVSQVVLEPFNDAEAGELFDAELPGVDSVTKAKVLARVDHNPLVLRLCLRVFGEEIQSGDFNEDLIPNSVEDAFRLIWKEFPKPIQQFLALAAHLGQDYFVDLLDEVTTATLSEGAKDLATKSAELNWVKSIDEILQSFGEITLFDITISSDAYRKATRDHKILRASLQTFTSSEDFEALSNQAKIILLQAQLRLAKTHRDMDPILAAEAGLRLSQLHAEAFVFTKQETCLEETLELLAGQLDTKLGFDVRRDLGEVKQELGKIQEALGIQELLLEDQIEVLGDVNSETLFSRGQLSKTLSAAGLHEEAFRLQKKVVEDCLQILGPDNEHTFIARRDLANALEELGYHEEARLAEREVLQDSLAAFGKDHPATLSALSYVASHLEEGQNDEALTMKVEILDGYLRAYGPDHPHVFGSRSNLAGTLHSLGRHEEALAMRVQVVQDYLRVLGPDHPSTFNARSRLASLLSSLGRHEEALVMHGHVLEDRLQVLGSDHPGTLSTRASIASEFSRMGRHEEALELKREVFEDHLRIFGPEHLDTLLSRSILASALGALDRQEEELEMRREVFEDHLRVFGPNHLHTLGLRFVLALQLDALGHYEEALTMHGQVLEDRLRVLGPDHPETLSGKTNLAVTLSALGRFEEALEMRQQVFEDYFRVLGPDHTDTLESRTSLASALAQLGRHEEELNLRREDLEESERVLGHEDLATLIARSLLVITLVELGQYDEAQELERQNLRDSDRIFGPEDQYTLESRSYLSYILTELGRHDNALELRSKDLEDRLRLFGPGDSQTLTARSRLASTLFLLGQDDEAQELERQNLEWQHHIFGPDHTDT